MLFAFLVRPLVWKVVTEALEKIYAQYRKEMEMIPFTKDRQTYCVIFFVLMVIGAIKLLVRSRRLVLFRNRVAKIPVHNQWSKYTIEDQEKQTILYCDMAICSDSVSLHNNIRADICKHCLHSVTLQGLSPFSDACRGSILLPLWRSPVASFTSCLLSWNPKCQKSVAPESPQALPTPKTPHWITPTNHNQNEDQNEKGKATTQTRRKTQNHGSW